MLRSAKLALPWMAVGRPSRLVAWSWLLLATCLWAGVAHAACATQSATVAPLGTVNIDVGSCSPTGTSGIVQQPLHGTAGPQGGSFSTLVTYTNTDGSASSDSFSFIDDSGATVLVNITIGVTSTPPIVLSPSTLPAGTVNASYSQQLTASGGNGGPYTFGASSGTLPTGLTLNQSTGVISGTPTEGGSFPLTLTASDGTDTGTRSYTLVIDGGLTVSPSSLPGAFLGQAYTQNFTTTGGTGSYSYAADLAIGPLPPGFSLNGAGTLSGTPTSTGSYDFAIKVTDTGSGVTQEVNYTLSVTNPPPTAGSVAATVAYDSSNNPITLALGGGTATSVAVASAPTHGTATASGTSITYTPTVGYAGADAFTYTATGPGGTSSAATASITVSPPTIAYAPPNPPAATVGAAYSQSLASASGGAAPYTYAVASGRLPAGLSLASNGTLSGTPTAGGNFSFTVTATDSSSGTGPFSASSGALTLTVNAPAIAISPGSVPNPSVASAYSQALTASGGTAPYTYAISAGSLPAGMSLGSDGLLSGTPTAAGTFNLTVTATDSSSGTGPYVGNRAYTITVNAPLITLGPASGTSFNGTVGAVLNLPFTAGNGTAPYSYALVVNSGTMPAGLTFNASSGLLSGTPTTAGTVNFSVTATDSTTGMGSPFTATGTFTLTVAAPTITLAPGTLPAPAVGAAYSQTVTASEALPATFTYAVTAGALPQGLSLNASSGAITGTPSAAGSFNFTITATDGSGFSGSRAYSVIVGAGTVSLGSATLAAATAETAYTHTFAASGGTAPYTYAIASGALPTGMTLSSAGVLSGTPTAAGTFNFTISATDSSTGTGAPFSAGQAYTLDVQAPAITVAPAALPNGKSGVAYSQQLSASGGSGSYGYSVTAGTVPAGLSLSSAGLLSGTPTAAGSFNFTVTATDGFGFTGSRAYTLAVDQPAPVAVNDSASTPANASATVAVTANDTGTIASIAIAQAPAHGSASVSGLGVLYTPSANFSGSDSFTYIATGPGGTSAPATVSVTVTPLSVPVAASLAVAVLGGKSVTIHATQGATGAPFTAVAIVTQPTSGKAAVSGTDIVYTAPLDASGTVGLDYTLANPFGTSQPAHVTITVNPVPLPAALSASVAAGRTVEVNLTATARGGPFTAAKLVAVTPSGAGSASIRSTASGYTLEFSADAAYSGPAQVSYTLSNAYATSAPATIAVTVTGRSDPSKDAEVLGILGAQADSARRLALGQIDNFQRRLEALHSGTGGGGFTNGISFGSASALQDSDPLQGLRGRDGNLGRRYLVEPEAPSPGQGARDAGPSGEWSVWTGGAVNFGKTQPGGSDNGIDFTTSGVSLGADRIFGDRFALGAGAGYGHDASDIGRHGSRSTVDSYSAAVYGSYLPAPQVYLDALLGYQWLSFDAHRYVTDNGNTVHGSRDGKQIFASLSVGYERRSGDGTLLSPYGRFDFARASLDSYTERGDAAYALRYERQTVKTDTGVLGLRTQWTVKRDYGMWMPLLRAEFRHDFQGASVAAMRYADLLGGPLYEAALDDASRNHTLLGAGVMLQTPGGLSVRLEYQNLLDSSTRDNQSIQLGVEKTFGP